MLLAVAVKMKDRTNPAPYAIAMRVAIFMVMVVLLAGFVIVGTSEIVVNVHRRRIAMIMFLLVREGRCSRAGL